MEISVGLGSVSHIHERVENTAAFFGIERATVQPHSADRLGHPGRVAAEQLVVFLNAHEFDHAQLHYKVVDQLLRVRFGNGALFQIALDINIEEGGVSADAHRRAVLILYGGEISEIQPLHGFLRRFRGAGNVEPVFRRHLL